MQEKSSDNQKLKRSKRRSWSFAVKKEAVEAVDSGLITIGEAMEKYGIGSPNTLSNWRRQVARGMVRRNSFTEVQRRRIVREVETGLLSQAEAREIYSIYGHVTIERWIARYGGECEIEPMAKRLKKKPEKRREYASAEEEVVALRKELENEQMKTLALETLIEVAEEELGVGIRKKAGAKQSEECEDDTCK